MVVDTYLAPPDYLEALGEECLLVQFEDGTGGSRQVTAHVLVNGNLHARSLGYRKVNPYTRLLLGPKYLVMRPEYWDACPLPDSDPGIMVTTGGSDLHNLLPKFLEALSPTPFDVTAVIGPYFTREQAAAAKDAAGSRAPPGTLSLIRNAESLLPYIARSSLAITACGTTVYEILRLQRRPVIFEIAENQLPLAEVLRKQGVPDLGWWEDLDWDCMGDTIQSCMEGAPAPSRLWRAIDGQGEPGG